MALAGTAGGRITAGVGANLIGQHAHDRNQEATVYVGNLDEAVTDALVWELFTQAGPVNNVYMPKDRVTNKHQGYGFVEFKGEMDADYAIKVINMIKLFGKPIRVNKASQDKKATDVGANLFIGNLDPDVDEKMLYDTFSAFGVIVATPKIMRDPDTGVSKGYGFVSYDSFEASDVAIETMHGQFLQNRAITAGYAFKKDSHGERHGTPAERLLAASMRQNNLMQSRPHTNFSAGPATRPGAQSDGQMAGNGLHPPPPPSAPAPPMPDGLQPPPAPAMQPPNLGYAPWGAQRPGGAPQPGQQPGPSGHMQRPPMPVGAPWNSMPPPPMQGLPPGHMGAQMQGMPRPGSAMPPPPWMRPQGMTMPLPPGGFSMARPPPQGLRPPPPGQGVPNFPPRPMSPPRPVQY